MNKVVERLLLSVDHLEKAINNAKAGLLKAAQAEAAERLSSYAGICEMQRRLARQLEGHIAAKNHGEVQHTVNLINGLSAMILDDVKVVMSGLPGGKTAAARQYC